MYCIKFTSCKNSHASNSSTINNRFYFIFLNSIRNELNPNVIKRVTNISLDKKEDEHNKWKKQKY